MTDVPRDAEDDVDNLIDDLDEDEHKDQRYTKRSWDKYIEKEGELSESEDEEENESNGVRRQPGTRKRRNMMDYQNADAVMDDDELGSGAGSPRRGRSRERDELCNRPDVEENGSAHSSNVNQDESAAFSEAGSVNASPHADAANLEDEDVDMADDSINLPPTHAQPSVDRPQEATPPDSPPAAAAPASTLPQPNANQDSNDPMDEGDTLDDPEMEKEETREDPEAADAATAVATAAAAAAEKSTEEVAEGKEDA